MKESSFPKWLKNAYLNLEQLSVLEENWNGRGAPEINSGILVAAEELFLGIRNRLPLDFPSPAIIPLEDGRLQIEWATRIKYVEIEFLDIYRVNCLLEEFSKVVFNEELLVDDLIMIAAVLKRFADI